MGKRPAIPEHDRCGYVTMRVTASREIPDGKVEKAERLLLRAGFRVDDTREVGLSHDGDECYMSHYYVAGDKITRGVIGWQARLRRTVYSVFEANHEELADVAVVTRDGAMVEMASWSCLRNRNMSLCTALKPNDATGARLVKIGGKNRILIEQETTYNLFTDMDAFKDSHTARCYVPETFLGINTP